MPWDSLSVVMVTPASQTGQWVGGWGGGGGGGGGPAGCGRQRQAVCRWVRGCGTSSATSNLPCWLDQLVLLAGHVIHPGWLSSLAPAFTCCDGGAGSAAVGQRLDHG